MKKEVNATRQQLKKTLCTNHSGKMIGMVSWSSSVLENTLCQQRRAAAERAYKIALHSGKDPEDIVDVVCRHCYAENLLDYRATARDKYKRNTELLTARVYDLDELPIINASIARIEAFGDVQDKEHGGIIQATNYMNWCLVNPSTTFGCWTKNLDVYDEVIRKQGKPENVIMIYSIPAINAAGVDPEAMLKALQVIFPWLDKLFIVYDKKHAAGVKINCGARECITCRRCYTKGTDAIIREVLK